MIISTLRDGITFLTNLTHLNILSSTSLTPSALNSLPLLRSLELHQSNFTHVDELSHLTSLLMPRQDLHSYSFASLSSLLVLHLPYRFYKELDLSPLVNLTELRASHPIKSFTSLLSLRSLTSVAQDSLNDDSLARNY